MKQVAQYQDGRLELQDVPMPTPPVGGALIRTTHSVISVGTEKMKVAQARMNLLQKARARPDQLRKVLDTAKNLGWRSAFEKVRNRLENGLAYSAVEYLEALRWRGPALAAHLAAIGDVDVVIAPASRALRHSVRCDEYRPSRRRIEPFAPSTAASYSANTASLYSAVKRRLVGRAAGSTPSDTPTSWTRPFNTAIGIDTEIGIRSRPTREDPQQRASHLSLTRRGRHGRRTTQPSTTGSSADRRIGSLSGDTTAGGRRTRYSGFMVTTRFRPRPLTGSA